MNKLLLLDAGLYGFRCMRGLTGVGFDLRLHWNDWKIGLRELAYYTPIAVTLGLVLGFLHWQPHLDRPWMIRARVALYLFLHRITRRDLFSRLDAESA